mgnify:CR=1 FL=1
MYELTSFFGKIKDKKNYYKSIKKLVENLDVRETKHANSKKIVITVCSDKNFSLDIKRLEEKLKLSRDKIFESFLRKNIFVI